MPEPIEIVTNFAQLLNGIEEHWNYLFDEIHKTDLKQTDILHEIEDGRFDIQRGYKKLKELQDLRKHRRELKDEQTVIEPLYNYWCQHKGLEIGLFKVKKSMEEKQEITKNWTYKPRTKEEGEEDA